MISFHVGCTYDFERLSKEPSIAQNESALIFFILTFEVGNMEFGTQGLKIGHGLVFIFSNGRTSNENRPWRKMRNAAC